VGKSKSKQILPSHFQLTSREMEACNTWKHLHTTQEIKYKNLVTALQKVSKLCEKKHFGSKFVVYKKMGNMNPQVTGKTNNKRKKKTIMELQLEEIRSH
jgi:hypothetical protein